MRGCLTGESAASRSVSSITAGTVRWMAEEYIGRALSWRVAASTRRSSLKPSDTQ
ncbi:MAG: hypothetical protein HY245_15535 [Rhizobiales bacterium]|nr:hypothetical protein [Hyphomicrobiales bacterium]MBI3674797.1 hypothetical protein [Hyphomicrobiales bacterium]